MCLIIASQNGTLADYGIVKRGFADNPDSWGIMQSSGRRVSISKGFKWGEFEREYARLQGDPYVVHFRYATHGAKDVANCHPFRVSNRLYMAHNGVIRIKTDNPLMSDTWHYAKWLRECGITDQNVAETLPAIGNDIGKGNKIAFLTTAGDLHIANANSGIWQGDVWLSNGNSLHEWNWSGDGYGPCEYCLTDDWLEEVDIEGIELQLCEGCVSWATRRGYVTA